MTELHKFLLIDKLIESLQLPADIILLIKKADIDFHKKSIKIKSLPQQEVMIDDDLIWSLIRKISDSYPHSEYLFYFQE